MKKDRNYLKYMRGARKYILMQHDVTLDELELCLYLREIGNFTREDLMRFNGLLSWDANRLGTLQKKDLVVKFRDACPGRFKSLYQISYRAKRLTNSFYNMLETGEFPDSSDSHHNKKSATRAEQKYGIYYRKENALRKEEKKKREL